MFSCLNDCVYYLFMQVGRDTLFDQLHKKVETIDGGKFHTLSHGLREEVERLSKQEHKWDFYNIDQLVCTLIPAYHARTLSLVIKL